MLQIFLLLLVLMQRSFASSVMSAIILRTLALKLSFLTRPSSGLNQTDSYCVYLRFDSA